MPDKVNIRDGKLEDYFVSLNKYASQASELTPFRPHLLSEADYTMISEGVEQFGTIIPAWRSNVSANGLDFQIRVFDDASDSTRAKKDRLKANLHKFLHDVHDWESVQDQVVRLLASQGNAVLMLNEEGTLIVHSIFRFNVYQNPIQKTTTYSLIVDGVEAITGLKHKEDLWHIKDPMFEGYAVAPSRIDLAYQMICLENKAVKLNTRQFETGWMSNILIQLSDAAERLAMNDNRDKEGKTWIQRQLIHLNDSLQGWRNAFRPGYVPGLKGIIEVGKSPRDAQFVELLKLTPERIAWAYSMTLTDFGAGGSTTYNNVSVFNDRLFDLVGRRIEQRLEAYLNNMFFKQFGIVLGTTRAVYNKPKNTEELEKAFAAGALTINEYREHLGKAPIEDGDRLPNEKPQQLQLKENSASFFTDAVERAANFRKKTPTEKAIASKKGKKFLVKWEKAFNAQGEAFVKKLDQKTIDKFLKEDDLEIIRAVLPKIESHYSFKALNEDLLYFAGRGLEIIQNDKRVETDFVFAQDEKLKTFEFAGEYPQQVLDVVEERTVFLIKGLETYAGVDQKTTETIASLIRSNAELPEKQLGALILKKLPEIARRRAETIARTEIANAVMETNFLMYKEYGATSKMLNPIIDDRSRASHVASGGVWIGIDQAFAAGFSRAGEAINCRCGMTFGFNNEHKNK